MIRLFLICLFWVILAGSAGAEAVRIRSGEHADFSRLVLEFSTRPTWQFGRVDGGFELRVGDDDLSFDLANVFDLIPRTRIASVEDRGGGRLFLSVTCDCHGDAFDLRGTQVVLDIKDGAPRSALAPFNTVLPDVAQGDAAMPTTHPIQAAGSVLGLAPASVTAEPATDAGAARHGLPLFLPTEAEAEPAVAESRDTAQDTEPMQENTPTHPDPSSRVAESEAALLEQLGRAAAQGLIQTDLSDFQAQVDRAADPLDHDDGAEQARAAPRMPDPPPTGPEAHVRVQTVIDRDNRAKPMPRAVTDTGQACPDDTLFDVAAWGNDISNGVDIGRYRTRLLGEFDQPDAAAVDAMVRYYIYLSFGAEAAALTRTYQELLDRPDIFYLLAGIMDETLADDGQLLAQYLDCGGKVALWAALAQERIAPGQAVNTNAVVTAFSVLPVHLRRHLGPSLAQKFIEADDETTAVALRNAIARAPGPHGTGLEVLNAAVAMRRDDTETAIAALEAVISKGDTMSPVAVIDLIDLKRGTGAPITPREMEIAASLAFEHRGTEMGTRLIAAEIGALIHMQAFNDAFARHQYYAARGEIAPEVSGRLKSDLLKALTTEADDATFLRHAIAADPADLPARTARLALAERLLDLGFPDEARTMIADPTRIPDRADRLLLARIALKERKFSVALGYLAGLAGDDAGLLTARALAGVKDHAGAARAFAAIGLEEAQGREAWRDGDWLQVAQLDKGPLSRAGALMQPDDRDPDQSDDAAAATLQSDRDLLNQSRATRAVLDDLLTALNIP